MKLLSWDTETSINSPNNVHGGTFREPTNDIYTQQWATHPDYVSVVHSRSGFKRRLYKTVEEELFYADYFIGVNLSFDMCYVWHNQSVRDYILRGGKIWCCQEAEYCLTGQQHTSASLAELQLKYLGSKQKPSKISYLFNKGIGADKIVAASRRCRRLFALYETYCKLDATTPLLIFKHQYIQAKKLGMLGYIEMRMDYLLAQINMSCTGIKIDLLKCQQLEKQYTIEHLRYLKQAREVLAKHWTDPLLPEFNLNSSDHKSAVLFGGRIKSPKNKKQLVGYWKNGNPRYKSIPQYIDIVGWQMPLTLTRAGARPGFYSTDGKVLKAIKNYAYAPQEVKLYCELQDLAMKYEKACNTYCKNFLARSVDGYLYPNLNNTITPTGRLSSSEPNLQNIPAKSMFADDLMGLIIAEPGYKCVSGDYSQLEKWIQAWVSGDLNLAEKLLQGVCLHCLTLANIEGLEYDWVYQKAKVEQDPVWDKKRTEIKPIGFRMDYGGGAKKTAQDLNLELEFVESVHNADKELFPDKYIFFEGTLPDIVKSTQTISLASNIAGYKKKGKDGAKILGNAELLPIFDKNGSLLYNNQELRHVGYWTTCYGKRYHFKDTGRLTQYGFRRSFRMPEFKNYPNQGGAADVQGATSAELIKVLITKPDKIKMLLEIHDSKLFYIREDVLLAAIKWLTTVVEDVPAIFKRRFGVDVPFKFPIEFKVGDSFAPSRMTKIKIGE